MPRVLIQHRIYGDIGGAVYRKNRMGFDRIDAESPWSGLKASGIGRESGVSGYRIYIAPKRVVVNMSNEPLDQVRQL